MRTSRYSRRKSSALRVESQPINHLAVFKDFAEDEDPTSDKTSNEVDEESTEDEN